MVSLAEVRDELTPICLRLFAPIAHDSLQRFDPLLVGGGQGADRPIAAKQDAVRAEGVERVVDDRC